MLKTPRLLMRLPTMTDADELAQMYRDPAIARYRANPNPLNFQETQDKLESIISHWQQHRFGRWMLIEQGTHRLIGHAGLEVPSVSVSGNPPEAELNYLIARCSWSQGFATEAATEILRDGFVRLGFHTITALIQPENQASIRVAEKLGMVREGCFQLGNRDWDAFQIGSNSFHNFQTQE